jgi:hypothetical protein
MATRESEGALARPRRSRRRSSSTKSACEGKAERTGFDSEFSPELAWHIPRRRAQLGRVATHTGETDRTREFEHGDGARQSLFLLHRVMVTGTLEGCERPPFPKGRRAWFHVDPRSDASL